MKPQDGSEMDRPVPGSVKRARERAAAGLPREVIPPPEPQMARPSAPRQPTSRSQAPLARSTRDGQTGLPISRPTPAPQWPLREPIVAPAQIDDEPFRSPASTASRPAPQRPPRPSRVPSILDASKVQDHTPVFQYRPRTERESTGQELLAVPETPSSLSRPSTLSSVASIPDFPLPAQVPPGPPRRSVNLGPPPSARRGASSFYSNASFVSPSPEESPRTRSHASFASSAAMPDNWGSPSPGPSPDYPDPVYSETATDERGQSPYGDDDTDQLVRSASLGKRAKPTLVSAALPRAADAADGDQRPAPVPLQGPFRNGTGYLENSSSSGTIPTVARPPIAAAMSADSILNAYSSASADDPSTPIQGDMPTPNPQTGGRPYSRLSAIRRPPRLDIDAVRKAEARGSLTSLPDLIRRATRLAASLEKGRRPASRFDDLDGFPDAGSDLEKRRSGLSDMLAAFPPPAHPPVPNPSRRSFRDSIREQVQSWPLPININRTHNTSEEAAANSDSQRLDEKRAGRRCCGLRRRWFVLIALIVTVLIAAAIVIPIEFFVIHKQDPNSNQPQAQLQRCQQQLRCANGGTNVVNQGVCSCICTNGFAGLDCTFADKTGCTTIALTGSDNIGNVTIGDAIPRLIQQALANFSIPLSTSDILPRLNAGNLSCSAENALVTFDGRATRQGNAAAPDIANAAAALIVDGIFFTTITVVIGPSTTFTLAGSATTLPATLTLLQPSSTTTTTTTTTRSPTATSAVTTTMTMSSGAPMPTSGSGTGTANGFAVSEEVLDFARVAVLFVLQADGLTEASAAQMALQKFFGGGSGSGSSSPSGISVDAARNVTVGQGKSVDLVGFAVDVGRGRVGGRSGSSGRRRRGWRG